MLEMAVGIFMLLMGIFIGVYLMTLYVAYHLSKGNIEYLKSNFSIWE